MNAKEIALEIKEKMDRLGWTHIHHPSIFKIAKRITRGSTEDFCTADMEYGCIFELMPTTTPGSTWGTDGGGIGAISAMQSGLFTMNKSGVSKRVLSALTKLTLKGA